MFTWPSGAPLVFDVVGGSISVTLLLLFFALPEMAKHGAFNRHVDPRAANYERLCGAIAGCALSLFIAYVVVFGLGGPVRFCGWLLRVIGKPQPWSVWFTTIGWAAITFRSVFDLSRGLKAPLGARMHLPWGRSIFQLGMFGLPWWFGLYLPQWADRGEWWWYFTLSLNFAIRCVYVLCITEALAGLVLPWLVRVGGGYRLAKAHTDDRNRAIISPRDLSTKGGKP